MNAQNKEKISIQDKGLLTVKEMCEYMSIGDHKARELLHRPYNPFTVRIGNRLYANKRLLDKWIDSQSGK